MFFYKLRKIFREKWLEILRGASMLGFIASFIPFFAYLFIWHDDFSRGEKRQMFLVSMICIIINLTIVYFTESIFGFNIIFSIFLADLFSFCLYLIPCITIMTIFEFSDLQLDKSEIRDAKLNSLFRKLF
jgi:Na+/melibiose symporter-like transporter